MKIAGGDADSHWVPIPPEECLDVVALCLDGLTALEGLCGCGKHVGLERFWTCLGSGLEIKTKG